MRFLIVLQILVAILHIGLLFKLAFALVLAVALCVLWRLKWVILAFVGLEELFWDRSR